MGLALTYSTLVTMLQNWAESDDAEYTTQINNIIKTAEDIMVKDLNLDIFNTTAVGSFSTGQILVTKPSDMLVVRSLSFLSGVNTVFLQPRASDYILSYWPDPTTTGVPKFYAEYTTTQWMIGPSCNGIYTYTARYTKRPESLSSTNTTTWLSTYAGDALFLLCMVLSESYLKEDSNEAGRIAMFKKDYARTIDSCRLEFQTMKQSNYQLGSFPPPMEG